MSIISNASLVSICLVCTLFGQTAPYPSKSASELVKQFKSEKVFWKQFKVGEKIVALGDKSVLRDLEPDLAQENRHLRGNAAFVFESLGDDRGFEVIKAILEDKSIARYSKYPPQPSVWTPQRGVAEDRYYAVYLFGHLKDSRAVPILLPLLNDEDLKFAVVVSLGHIGDKCAIPPLIDILDDVRKPYMRLLVIQALEQLDAKEALPILHALIDDGSAYFDISVPLAAAARKAIDTLEQKP